MILNPHQEASELLMPLFILSRQITIAQDISMGTFDENHKNDIK